MGVTLPALFMDSGAGGAISAMITQTLRAAANLVACRRPFRMIDCFSSLSRCPAIFREQGLEESLTAPQSHADQDQPYNNREIPSLKNLASSSVCE